jgi:hypothetical protein
VAAVRLTPQTHLVYLAALVVVAILALVVKELLDKEMLVQVLAL